MAIWQPKIRTGLRWAVLTAGLVFPLMAGAAWGERWPASPDTAEASPVTSNGWQIECVECPLFISDMTSRSLQVDAQGNPHIAIGGDHLYYAWYDGHSWQIETADDAPLVGSTASLELDPNGAPHISYVDSFQPGLRYAHRDNAGWHTQAVTGTLGSTTYPSLALDPGGNPNLSFFTNDGVLTDTLKHAFLEPDGWHFETVDNAGGYSSSIVSGQDGYARISYGSWDSLRYAYQDAAGWHTLTLDSAAIVGNSSMVLATDGQPHIGYSDWQSNAVKYTYQDGSGWHTETVVSGPGSTTSLSFVSLALDPDGDPHIGYIDVTDGKLMYAYRDQAGWHTQTIDSGLTWESREPSLVIDSAGRAHLAYFVQRPWTNGELRYAVQDAAGWRTQVVAFKGSAGRQSSLALDRFGHPHIGYHENLTDDLKYAYKDFAGWHTQTVDELGGWYPSLVIDPGGYPHMSYSVWGAVKYAYQDPSGWHTEFVEIWGTRQHASALALDQDGKPHLVFRNPDGNLLRYAYKDASGWQIITLDSVLELTDGISLAIDRSGYPHVSYGKGGQWVDQQMYAYQDINGWHFQTVDTLETIGWHSDLALDSAGLPHLTYSAGALGSLRYAYLDAGGWHIQTVTLNLDLYAGRPVLALDKSDSPHISYFDSRDSSLKYVHQDAGGWRFQTVDSHLGGTGGQPSIALDRLSQPVISYFDGLTYDLKLARSGLSPSAFIHLPLAIND